MTAIADKYRPNPTTNSDATRPAWPFILAAFVFTGSLPLFAGDYFLLLAGQTAIMVIAVAGLNILTGMTGLISLGHAAFFAIGAYVAAVGAKSAGLPIAVTLPLAVLAAALVGIVVGLPALRVRGFYLAVATLAANFLVVFLIERDWLAPYTGGVSGIESPIASIFGFDIVSPAARYLLVTPFAIVAVVLTHNLVRTRIGRAFIALRDRDYSAEILGISLVRYKLTSFAISAAFCGLAGGLWAYYFAAIQPTDFGLILSIQFVAALIIGGQGTVLGPVVGAAFLIFVPELLKIGFFYGSGGDVISQRFLGPTREIIFGALIIVFLIFESKGLMALFERLLSVLRHRILLNRQRTP